MYTVVIKSIHYSIYICHKTSRKKKDTAHNKNINKTKQSNHNYELTQSVCS